MLIALTAWSVQWHVDLSIIRGDPIIESAYIPEREKREKETEGEGEKRRKERVTDALAR